MSFWSHVDARSKGKSLSIASILQDTLVAAYRPARSHGEGSHPRRLTWTARALNAECLSVWAWALRITDTHVMTLSFSLSMGGEDHLYTCHDTVVQSEHGHWGSSIHNYVMTLSFCLSMDTEDHLYTCHDTVVQSEHGRWGSPIHYYVMTLSFCLSMGGEDHLYTCHDTVVQSEHGRWGSPLHMSWHCRSVWAWAVRITSIHVMTMSFCLSMDTEDHLYTCHDTVVQSEHGRWGSPIHMSWHCRSVWAWTLRITSTHVMALSFCLSMDVEDHRYTCHDTAVQSEHGHWGSPLHMSWHCRSVWAWTLKITSTHVMTLSFCLSMDIEDHLYTIMSWHCRSVWAWTLRITSTHVMTLSFCLSMDIEDHLYTIMSWHCRSVWAWAVRITSTLLCLDTVVQSEHGHWGSPLHYYVRTLSFCLSMGGEDHLYTCHDTVVQSEHGRWGSPLHMSWHCRSVWAWAVRITSTLLCLDTVVQSEHGHWGSPLHYYVMTLSFCLSMGGEDHLYTCLDTVVQSEHGHWGSPLHYYVLTLSFSLSIDTEDHLYTCHDTVVQSEHGHWGSPLHYYVMTLSFSLSMDIEDHLYTIMSWHCRSVWAWTLRITSTHVMTLSFSLSIDTEDHLYTCHDTVVQSEHGHWGSPLHMSWHCRSVWALTLRITSTHVMTLSFSLSMDTEDHLYTCHDTVVQSEHGHWGSPLHMSWHCRSVWALTLRITSTHVMTLSFSLSIDTEDHLYTCHDTVVQSEHGHWGSPLHMSWHCRSVWALTLRITSTHVMTLSFSLSIDTEDHLYTCHDTVVQSEHWHWGSPLHMSWHCRSVWALTLRITSTHVMTLSFSLSMDTEDHLYTCHDTVVQSEHWHWGSPLHMSWHCRSVWAWAVRITSTHVMTLSFSLSMDTEDHLYTCHDTVVQSEHSHGESPLHYYVMTIQLILIL